MVVRYNMSEIQCSRKEIYSLASQERSLFLSFCVWIQYIKLISLSVRLFDEYHREPDDISFCTFPYVSSVHLLI